MGKKYKDAIIGIILAGLALIYLALSFRIKLTNIDRIVGSRLFPQICGLILLALSLCLAVGDFWKARHQELEEKKEKRNYLRTILVLGCYAAYIFLMDKIGFMASSVLYLFSQMIVMGKWPVGKKSLAFFLITAVIVSLVISVVFNDVFMLILPKAGWF